MCTTHMKECAYMREDNNIRQTFAGIDSVVVGLNSPLKSSISASSYQLSIPCESLFYHRQGSRGHRSLRVSGRTKIIGVTHRAITWSPSHRCGPAGTHHESQGTGVDVGVIHAAVDFVCTVPVWWALVLVTEPPRLWCVTENGTWLRVNFLLSIILRNRFWVRHKRVKDVLCGVVWMI